MRKACSKLTLLILSALSLPLLLPAQTPSPSRPPQSATPAPTPHLTPAQARARLEELNKELKELNEKFKRAEERILEGDPGLTQLKSLKEEAKHEYDRATQNWLDVHTRYTKLYHELKEKYDKELQEKIQALMDDYKQKFDNEWAAYQAERAEENRLMQRLHDGALARAKAAANQYAEALLQALPELSDIGERIRQIRAAQHPLIMLLKPPSHPLTAPPLRAATPSSHYPTQPRRPTPETSQ